MSLVTDHVDACMRADEIIAFLKARGYRCKRATDGTYSVWSRTGWQAPQPGAGYPSATAAWKACKNLRLGDLER